MSRRAIVIAVPALLILGAGVLLLVLRQQPSAVDETIPAPLAERAADKAPVPPSQPEPVDLGSVLDLQRLAECEQSPRLAAILEAMVRIDPTTFESRRGGPIEVPGYAQSPVPTFERVRETDGRSDSRLVTAELDLPGRWHGLAVAGLRRSFYEESDASAFEIRFAEPAERVRKTLVRHGFRLPPVGESREVDEEELGISTEIGVGPGAGGATLTCATG